MLYVGMLWCFKLECCGVVVLHGGVLWRVVVFNDGALWSVGVFYVGVLRSCGALWCSVVDMWSVVVLWCFML